MRIWHKDLIKVLPQKQLVAQWRELCCMAKNVRKDGTPNHLLVNKILNYPLNHFVVYSNMVLKEMSDRKINVNKNTYLKFVENLEAGGKHFNNDIDKVIPVWNEIFGSWHNERYLIQCLHNLEEKYDCGGMSEDEWNKIKDQFYEVLYR